MSFREGLFSFVTEDAAVAALIGTRFFPTMANQDEDLPLAVYQQISSPPEHSHQGPTGLQHPRIQISSIAEDPDAAWALAAAMKARLDGKKAVMFGSVEVQAVLMVNEFEHPYEFESQRFRVTQDYMIWYCQ